MSKVHVEFRDTRGTPSRSMDSERGPMRTKLGNIAAMGGPVRQHPIWEATSTAIGADTSSSRKRSHSTTNAPAKRTRTQDLSEILANTADAIAGSDDILLDTAPRKAPQSVLVSTAAPGGRLEFGCWVERGAWRGAGLALLSFGSCVWLNRARAVVQVFYSAFLRRCTCVLLLSRGSEKA